MTDTTTEYGRFLRDAIVYLIATRDDNFRDEYGHDADPAAVPAFHYWVTGGSPKDFVVIDGDAVMVTAVVGGQRETRSLFIEANRPEEAGFAVLVSHAAGQAHTNAWQDFVIDAIDLYVGFALGDLYFEGGSYGDLDAELRRIIDAIEAGTLDAYEWANQDDVVGYGDVQDDQDYAAVEYRLFQVQA